MTEKMTTVLLKFYKRAELRNKCGTAVHTAKHVKSGLRNCGTKIRNIHYMGICVTHNLCVYINSLAHETMCEIVPQFRNIKKTAINSRKNCGT